MVGVKINPSPIIYKNVVKSYRLVGFTGVMMQARSQETHDHILVSAGRLISEKGYRETSVSDICEFAGISKGAFYYHFPTKQALFIALLQVWLGNLETAFNAIVAQKKNVPEAILSMTRMAGTELASSDENVSILMEFWMQAYRDPLIWEAAIAPYRRYLSYFSSLYQEGIQEGSIKHIDPEVAARITVSIGLGIMLQALFDPKEMLWDQALSNSMTMFIESISRS